MTGPARPRFPYELFDTALLPAGPVGDLIRRLEPVSLKPPYPWGQWLYAPLLAAAPPGDVVECGVARGGMSVFLGHLGAAQGRRVWSCDSFAGLPAPDPVLDNPYFRTDDYRARPERGTDLLARFRALVHAEGLDDVVTAVPGWFADTLPTLPADRPVAFLHIDADLYASVHDTLEALWDRVVDGGIVVLDDYFHHAQGPKRAAADFFNGRGILPCHHVSFPYTVFVVKGEYRHVGRAPRSLDGNWYSFEHLRRDAPFVAAVDALAASLDADPAVPERERANARLLHELLTGRTRRSADVYDFWRSLEDFWDGMSLHGAVTVTGVHREPIRL